MVFLVGLKAKHWQNDMRFHGTVVEREASPLLIYAVYAKLLRLICHRFFCPYGWPVGSTYALLDTGFLLQSVTIHGQCHLLKLFLAEIQLCKALNYQVLSNTDQGPDGLS